jgi:[ribosomal protein S18]-alanine N-acetyltransferase
VTSLRTARRADLVDIARIELEAFGSQAWSVAALTPELPPDAVEPGSLPATPPAFPASASVRPTRHAVVSTAGGTPGERDGHAVGYALLMYSGEMADILRLAVSPEYRRQGRGAALVRALVDFATACGCTHVLLEVAADNLGARRCYEQQGFEVIHHRRGYSGEADTLVLRRSLSSPGTSASPEQAESPDGR